MQNAKVIFNLCHCIINVIFTNFHIYLPVFAASLTDVLCVSLF